MTKEEAIWILENRTVTGELKPRIGGYTDLYDFCLEALKQTSAQSEIIRCKDCENLQTDWKPHDSDRYYCAMIDGMIEEDGFCSHAERKEDE